nr:stage II sporulation protein P [Evansella caseinilytica]
MKDYVLTTIIGLVMFFIITGILASSGFSSDSIKQSIATISEEQFIYIMSYENHYFEQVLPETFDKPSALQMSFELVTSIDTGDLRTLLGREIPALASFDTRIVTAGEGTNLSTLPYESSPPLDVLLTDREASYEVASADSEEEETAGEQSGNEKEAEVKMTTIDDGEATVLIHHTHSWESFLPHLNVPDNNPNLAAHNELNITLVGEHFGKELEKRGFHVIVDTRDMTAELHKRDWTTNQSYDISREYVKEYLKENEIDYIFDLHRDSATKDITTVNHNGKNLARPFFVLGEGHQNYEKNEMVVSEFNALIEKDYPGLSRGIFAKDKSSGNGIYNQDLSENTFLMEIGGVDNNLDELYKTAEIIAEIFTKYYLQHRESND